VQQNNETNLLDDDEDDMFGNVDISAENDKLESNEDNSAGDAKIQTNKIQSSTQNSAQNTPNKTTSPSVTISRLQNNGNDDDHCSQLSLEHNFENFASISIKETETQIEENVTGVGGNYVVYLVEILPKDGSNISYSSVWRRFSEFDMLRDFFVATYKHVIIPVIPSKTLNRMQKNLKSSILQGHKAAHAERIENTISDTSNPKFIETRRIRLERFLTRVANHPELSHSKIFWEFLQNPTSWKFTAEQTGYRHKLSSMNGLNLDKSVQLESSIYNSVFQLEHTMKDFLEAFRKQSLAEHSLMKVYDNYARGLQLLSEIQPNVRKEFSMASPIFSLFLQIADESQLKEFRGPLSHLQDIERTIRKSIHFGQAVHFSKYQNETRFAENRLHETKSERGELSSGNIPKGISSLRGFGSMMKAIVETNVEREARAKKLERREALEHQLVNKTHEEFGSFKGLCEVELSKFNLERDSTTKAVLKELVRNKIEYLKRSRDNWKEIYDTLQ